MADDGVLRTHLDVAKNGLNNIYSMRDVNVQESALMVVAEALTGILELLTGVIGDQVTKNRVFDMSQIELDWPRR